MDQTNSPRSNVIKNIYLYLVSFVALMMVIFSMADTVNIALRTWVFTKADRAFFSEPYLACESGKIAVQDNAPRAITPEECQIAQDRSKKQQEEQRIAEKQRDAVRDISMIVVGIPLFMYHWMIIRKKERNTAS